MKYAKSLLTSLLGVAVAALFLHFAFRGMDLAQLRQLLSRISPLQATGMIVFCVLGVVLRGVRWYYLLPAPIQPGELWACQRAIAISYGINNLLSRVGELVRIAVFSRDSGRSLAVLGASLVVDRLAFDSVLFALLVGGSLLAFREPLQQTLPELAPALVLFAAITLAGLAAMLFLTLFPQHFKQLATRLGLRKIGFLRQRLDPLIDQLAAGLAVLKRPRHLLGLHIVNLLAWLAGYGNFLLALQSVGIQLETSQALLLFTVASFGFLLPSPGGIGAFHYFMVLGGTGLLQLDKGETLAAATICHGINYLVITVLALAAWLVPAKVSRDIAASP